MLLYGSMRMCGCVAVCPSACPLISVYRNAPLSRMFATNKLIPMMLKKMCRVCLRSNTLLRYFRYSTTTDREAAAGRESPFYPTTSIDRQSRSIFPFG